MSPNTKILKRGVAQKKIGEKPILKRPRKAVLSKKLLSQPSSKWRRLGVLILLITFIYTSTSLVFATPQEEFTHELVYPRACQGTWREMQNVMTQENDSLAEASQYVSDNSASPDSNEITTVVAEGFENNNGFIAEVPELAEIITSLEAPSEAAPEDLDFTIVESPEVVAPDNVTEEPTVLQEPEGPVESDEVPAPTPTPEPEVEEPLGFFLFGSPAHAAEDEASVASTEIQEPLVNDSVESEEPATALDDLITLPEMLPEVPAEATVLITEEQIQEAPVGEVEESILPDTAVVEAPVVPEIINTDWVSCTDFAAPSASQVMGVRLGLSLSLASYTTPLTVSFSQDGQRTWQPLGTVAAGTTGYVMLDVPETFVVDLAHRTFVRLATPQSVITDDAGIFIDSLWLDYEELRTTPTKTSLVTENDTATPTAQPSFGLRFDPAVPPSWASRVLSFMNGAMAAATDDETTVPVETWDDPESKVTARVIDAAGQVAWVTPTLERTGYGAFTIDLPTRAVVPGRYILETTIHRADTTEVATQDFIWGVLVVNTDQSVYAAGDTAQLSFGAVDQQGNTICDAVITAAVIDPDGVSTHLSTENGSIARSTECGPITVTNTPDYGATYATIVPGTYTISVTARSEKGDFTITDSFVATDELPYQVKRTAASRIYPLALYTMELEVTAREAFNGVVKEIVPEGFSITPQEGMMVTPYEPQLSEHALEISWSVALAAGETKVLTYEYDAPDVSPYLYRLGPLALAVDEASDPVFTEVRQWQIAVDLTSTKTFSSNSAVTSGDTAPNNGFETTPTGANADGGSVALDTNSGGPGNTDDNDTCAGAFTDRHQFYNFGFAITSGATINGITVHLEAFVDSTAGTTQMGARLTPDRTAGSPTWAGPKTATLTTGEAPYDLGGASDTWSRSWISSELNSSNFAVEICNTESAGTANNRDFSLDYLTVAVDYTEAAFTVSGTVYTDEGSSNIGANKTVNLRVNGAGAYTDETDSSGVYSITNVTATSGDVITVYLDGEGVTEKATTVTRSAGVAISDLHLYQNRLIVRHEDSGPTTNTNLGQFDKDNDADIHFTSNSGTLTIDNDTELHVSSSKTFTPGGTVTLSSGGASPGGDLHVLGTLTMDANTLNVNGGDITGAGTITQTGAATVVLDTGTVGGGTYAFYNLTLGDGSAVKTTTLGSAITVTNNLTIRPNHTLDTSSGNNYSLTVGGSWSNSGTLAPRAGTVTMNGAGGQLDSVTVDSAGLVGFYGSSLQLDSSGYPVIAYYDDTDADLELVHCGDSTCSSGNTFTTVHSAGSYGKYPSLQLDSSGYPVISYYDATLTALRLVHCGDANCSSGNTFTIVDNTASVGQYSSLQLDSSGYPVISYQDSNSNDGNLKLVHCGDATCSSGNTITTIDSTGDTGFDTSLALDSSGFPVIAYRDNTGLDLELVHCGDATCSSGNTLTTVDSTGNVGSSASLKLDSSGYPVISYYDTTNGDLDLVHCGNATCSSGNTFTTVESSGTVGVYTSLQLDSSGNPIIAYRHFTNTELKIVRCGNSTCSSGNTVTVADTAGNVGEYPSLISTPAFDIVSYYDRDNQDLKVVKFTHYFTIASPGSGTKSFYNLTLNGTGSTFLLGSALDVDNNLTVTAGTLDVNTPTSYGITVGGNWSNSATFTARSGTVTFDAGATGKTIAANSQAFYNIAFSNNSGGWILQDATTTVTNDVSGTGGALSLNGKNLAVNGGDIATASTIYCGNGNNTCSTGTVTLDGTGNIDGGTYTFYNLTLGDGSGSTTTTLQSGTYAVTNDLLISANQTLALNDQSMTVNGGDITGTGTISCSGCTAGTVTLDGTGNIDGGTYTFYNLALGDGTGSTTTTLQAGTYTLGGDLSVAANQTLEMNNQSLAINGGDISGSGTIACASCSSGTVTMGGTGSVGGGTYTFYNFSVGTGSSTITTTAAGNFTVKSILAIVSSSGTNTFDASSRTITLTASGTPFTIAATEIFTPTTSTFVYTSISLTTLTATTYYNVDLLPTADMVGTSYALPSGTTTTANNFRCGNGSFLTTCRANSNAGNLDVNGNFSIGSNATFVADAVATLSVAGNWTNSGTFTHTNGTVTFDGTASGKTINPGSSSFYNLTLNGSGGVWSPLTNTITVANDLTMTAGTLDSSNGSADVTVNSNVAGTAGVIALTAGTFTQRVGGSKNFGTTSGSANWSFNNLTFSRSASTPTITTQTGGSGTITVTTVLTVGAGGDGAATTLDPGNRTWILSGTGTPLAFNASSVLSSSNSSTFRYTGNGATTVVALTTYNNLQVYPGGAAVTHTLGAGTFTLTGNLDLGGNSNAASTVITAATNNPTINVKGNVTVCASTCSNQMTFTKGSGTLTMNSTANSVTLTDNNPTTQDLGAVVIGNASAAKTVTLGGSAKLTTVNITANATLSLGGTYTLTITGGGTPLTRGGSFTSSTGTVEYTSTSGVTALSSAAMTISNVYYNLIINGSGQTFNAGVAVGVKNQVLVSAGTLSMGTNALTMGNTLVANSGSIKVASGQTFTQSSSGTTTILNAASGANCIGSSGASCVGTPGTITFGNLTIGDAATSFTTTLGGTTPAVTVAGVLTVTANALLDAAAGTVTLSGNGTPFDMGGADRLTESTSTFVYTNGTSANVTATTYYHLQTNGAGTYTALGTTIATGNLTVSNGTLAMGTNTLTVGASGGSGTGSITGAGTITQTGGTTTLQGTGTLGGGTYTFYNLTLGDGSSTRTTTTGGAFTVSNDFTTSAAHTLAGTNNVTVNGSVAGTGTINLTGGTFEQRVAAAENFGTTSGSTTWTFNNLTFSDSAGSPFTVTTQTGGSGGITIAGILLVSKTGDAAATTLDAGNRTWTLSNSNSAAPFDMDQASGVLTGSTSTFVYSGDNDAGDVAVENATYNALTLGGAVAENYAPEGATTVAGDLTMDTNGTLTGTANVTTNGNVVGAGTVNLSGGTFEQNVAADKTFGSSTGSNTWTFNNLKMNNSSGTNRVITPNAGTGAVVVSGTFTLGDSGTNSITFDNETTNDRILDLNGALTISTLGVLSASSSAAFTSAGNFTNNGTFTANSGTVTFDTTSTSILNGSGNPAIVFNNLTSTTPNKTLEFTASKTFRIDGVLTLTGTSGNEIHVHSTSGSTQWFINHQGTESVEYIHIEDSGCAGGTTNITTTNSIDGDGNNGSCWILGGTPTLSFSLSSTTATLAMNSGNTFTATATTTLTTSTNAASGYRIYAYKSAPLTHTSYGANTISDWTGTYATPTTWTTTCSGASACGFGYNTNDADIAQFGANEYAALSSTASGDLVATSAADVDDEAVTITYRASVGPAQAAGAYQTTIYYIVTGEF